MVSSGFHSPPFRIQIGGVVGLLLFDVIRGEGELPVVVVVLADSHLGPGWPRLDRFEEVGRLTVDLAVHDLLETTHHDPGVHGALFAQLGAIRLVDGLAELPHVVDPHEGLLEEAASAVVAVQALVTDAAALGARSAVRAQTYRVARCC